MYEKLSSEGAPQLLLYAREAQPPMILDAPAFRRRRFRVQRVRYGGQDYPRIAFGGEWLADLGYRPGDPIDLALGYRRELYLRRVGDMGVKLALGVRRVHAAMLAAERAAAGAYRYRVVRFGKLKREADIAAVAGAVNAPHAGIRWHARASRPDLRRR